MCNSSIQLNLSHSIYDWYCICDGHFGTSLMLYVSLLCFIVGTPFHSWCLWHLLCVSIKPNSVFLINITVLDLFYSIQSIFDIIVTYSSSVECDQLGHFLIGLCWTLRPLIQICICVEQYLAVIHPVTFLRYKDIQYRIAAATLAWLVTMANSIRLSITGSDFFPDHVLSFFFCLAVIITSFCCASVLRVLKHPGPGDVNNALRSGVDKKKSNDRSRAAENQQKMKAFRIISHVLLAILICYVPLITSYFMHLGKWEHQLLLCEVIPLFVSVNMVSVLMTPLFKMWREGQLKHIKCFK